ncbi:MAG TPA: LUD domain-containing protein [Clostridia bacterium]|nr:LUD domain-containing protein [Clostridia bacterium]
MEGFYCETREDALKKVLEIIPKDSMVSCGGSATVHD